MCGRYVLDTDTAEIKREFDVIVEKIQEDLERPRFNIAPSQIVAAVRQFDDERRLSGLKWGLVPSWAKDARVGNRMINARAESIREKPSFRAAFKSKRCLIPASGFYEWKRLGDKTGKQPFYFYLKNKPVFGFAGLWENWTDETGAELETCTIITTEANAVLAPVHDRMPVIVKPEDYELWLDATVKDQAKLETLLAPYPAEEMQSHAASRQINNPAFDSPELINSL